MIARCVRWGMLQMRGDRDMDATYQPLAIWQKEERHMHQRFTAACAAMQGLLAGGGTVFADGSRGTSTHEVSFWAVNHADALLKVLAGGTCTLEAELAAARVALAVEQAELERVKGECDALIRDSNAMYHALSAERDALQIENSKLTAHNR